jgi:hypothetical protein
VSQIASGYVVGLGLLERLGGPADGPDGAGFWAALHSSAAHVTPEYPYSGHVFVTLLAYLEEQGFLLPASPPDPLARSIPDGDGLVGCVGRDEAAPLLVQLDALVLSREEMGDYFEEFTQQPWEEAGIAMQEGISFLKRALQQLHNEDDWLMILVS